MTLDSEEYYNIWLRMKDSLIHWIVFWITFLFICLGLLGYLGITHSINNKVDRSVDRYIKSESFKTKIHNELLSKIPKLKNDLNRIEKKAEEKVKDLDNKSASILSVLDNAPYEFNSNSISFVNKNGTNVTFEYGQLEWNDENFNNKIKFDTNFNSPPKIIVSLSFSSKEISSGFFAAADVKIPQPTVYSVTDNSFKLYNVHETFFSNEKDNPLVIDNKLKINWLAIGLTQAIDKKR